jgi:hypothetical protein
LRFATVPAPAEREAGGRPSTMKRNSVSVDGSTVVAYYDD